MPNSLALIRHEGARQGIIPPSRIRLRSYASERTLSAIWADSAPERRTGRGLPGARGAARARPRVALVCAPRGPPRRIARRVCPHPPWCARLGPGPLRPSLPGPWALGPGSPAPFSPLRPRRCARPLGRWGPASVGVSGGRARCGGAGLPPPWLARASRSPLLCGLPRGGSVALVCCARAARPSRRARVLPPSAVGGGPWARLGPPPARWCPPSLHRRGARAGCGPRFGARCAPRRGYGFVGPGSFAPFVVRVGGILPHGGPPWAARAALAGGNGLQTVLSVGARSERGKFAQGTLSPRLGADSVRLQLRY